MITWIPGIIGILTATLVFALARPHFGGLSLASALIYGGLMWWGYALAWQLGRWAIRPWLPPKPLPYGEHWARENEITPLVVAPGYERSALLLARYDDKLLGLSGNPRRSELGHVLVCAPTRRGKGLMLISNLLRWHGSAVVVDIKGENFQKTAGLRAQRKQKVYVLDPSGQGHRYDPFLELGATDEGLYKAATLLLEDPKDKDPIFAQRAGFALFACFLAAKKLGHSSTEYLRYATAKGLQGFVETLSALGDPAIDQALTDFLLKRPRQMTWNEIATDRFLMSSWGNLITRCRPVFSRGVLAMTSGSDFSARDLIEGRVTVYLRFREGNLDYTLKALQVVLLSLVDAMIRYADEATPKVPLVFHFDEAGRVPIPRLDDLVSTLAGRRISAVIYVQSLGQLISKYGRDNAPTIRDNCATQVYFSPNDKLTAEDISAMAGETTLIEIEESEKAESGGIGVDRVKREKFTTRALITPAEVRQLGTDQVIIFSDQDGVPPVLGTRLEYFDYPWGDKPSRIPPPALESLEFKSALGVVAEPDPPESREAPEADMNDRLRRYEAAEEGAEIE